MEMETLPGRPVVTGNILQSTSRPSAEALTHKAALGARAAPSLKQKVSADEKGGDGEEEEEEDETDTLEGWRLEVGWCL